MRNMLKTKVINKAKDMIFRQQSAMLEKVIQAIKAVDMSKSEDRLAITKALRKIATWVIIQSVGMADMPLILYLLSLKYNGRVAGEFGSKDASILINGKFIAKMSYLAVYIHFIDVKDDMLRIEGNVSQPTVFRDAGDFFIKNNDFNVKCQMYEHGLDLKLGNNIYEKRTVFVAEIPLSKTGNTITFYNKLGLHECIYGKINAMRFSPIADCMKNQFCRKGKWILYIQKNRLFCDMATEAYVTEKEMLFEEEIKEKYPEKANWAISLRKACVEGLREKQKPIWLFMDKPDRADDNAEVLFEYATKNKAIDCYFIILKGTKDFHRLSKYDNVIAMHSREHYELVLKADFIISSQANGSIENPFWEDAELFRDYYHNPKIIFLQHGIIKDDMSYTLSRYHTNFAGFVTSSKREKDSILQSPYFYTEKEIWLTGLPRYDKLYNNPKRYILIMPTWRQGLMEEKWDSEKNSMIWNVKEGFTSSDYFKTYFSLLHNESLKTACDEYGYKLAFMPHPMIEPYMHLFKDDSNCLFWDSSKSYREAFAEGALLVTDYSSVAFDFSYLMKPVIYYQFDKEEFFESHSYRQGYFDYVNDGLGEVLYDEEKLIHTIVKYMEKECALKTLYESRIKSTFEYVDDKNCERVFECILRCNKE